MAILIKNGILVSSEAEFATDLLIEGEKITAMGSGLDDRAQVIVDAAGKYLLPGGVDNHTHFGLSFQGCMSRGCRTSPAAVVGGTTTVVDFVPQPTGMGLIESAIRYREDKFEGHCTPDFALHAMVQDRTDTMFDEMKHLPDIGIATLKMFMAYKGSVNYCDDKTVLRALANAKQVGVTAMIHAENCDMIDYFTEQLVSIGKLDTQYHGQSRPAIAEAECINRAIYLARSVKAPVYFVHVSTKEGTELIRDARLKGQPVFGETCPQYLCLTEDVMNMPDFEGAKFVCSPPLRTVTDQDALWLAIQKGWLHTLATDHCAFDFANQKMSAFGDFTKIANGLPGVQHRLHILWTYGVASGRISRGRAVDVFATTPAKLNGLYPQKGALQVGADADIVIFDPNYRGHITIADCCEGVDYTPYEGLKQIGRADQVYLRGRLVAKHGKLVAGEGAGCFIPAQPFALAYKQV